MPNAAIKTPGPDHPITLAAHAGRVVVTLNGTTLADSPRALLLQEAGYPPVYYLPRADVDMRALARTPESTYCPYKGHAAYYAPVGTAGPGIAWSYERPHAAVHAIAGHLAFYPDRVDAIQVD
ncbi:DUF427 domain-containing protein [Pseudoxanthomonas sp. JBR18]|uniref:DUF427 domain-containing protein n=1 Tax=Pseudoxanthomonas sp. JBR18 TaxID=2969308 RepID=UPI0023063FDC|nr:DUF427 domain-containing protein [Pseudoxanthomonas sp. JBR18]WCE05996.1 DUF427 domain-containing protein [Pseudoxanthomonas sp. JBR18]